MINMSEYAARRSALMKSVGQNDIVILSSAKEVYRNGDATFPFRQHSDFYYLTGFNEPEAVLVLLPNHQGGEFILFNRPRDQDKEMWDGPRAGQEGACQLYAANQAFPITQFSEKLPELLLGRDMIHYTLGNDVYFDSIVLDAVKSIRGKMRSGVKGPSQFCDVAQGLHELRLIKSTAEIAKMQKAVDITVQGHLAAMQICQPNRMEYEIEATLLYEFLRQGARNVAYNSIVAAGKNACVLHYVANNQKMNDGDLLLIDAGAEYDCYAADLTRTFPVNGVFTGEQRAIYEIVLKAQEAAIAAIKPGVLWNESQTIIVKVITEGLVDVGLLKGNVDSLIEQQAYVPFYMHKAGHWLGLDVHDVGCYRMNNEWRPLQSGMVLTVEPGIYIGAHIKGVPAKWQNIGVRIEDDVVVTDKGATVLSSALPKTVDDIQHLMKT